MLPGPFPVVSVLAGWTGRALMTPGQTSVASQLYIGVCPVQKG